MVPATYYIVGEKGMGPGVDTSYLPLAPQDTFPADPSGNTMKLINMWNEGRSNPETSPERIAIGKEMFQIHDEEIYRVHTVGFSGSSRGVYINRNNVKNQPFYESREHYGGHAWVYFFEDGIDNLNHPGNKSKYSESLSFIGGN